MERQLAIQEVSREIENLARMHILYGIQDTSVFEQKKVRIKELIEQNHINWRNDLDPVFCNLYRRYYD